MLFSAMNQRISSEASDNPSSIPTDPSDKYFLTHCFVCQAVAKPEQVAIRESISPTFHAQFLRSQIPKAQKDSQLKQLFVLLGSASVKAASKHVDEIDPRSQSFRSLLFKLVFLFSLLSLRVLNTLVQLYLPRNY